MASRCMCSTHATHDVSEDTLELNSYKERQAAYANFKRPGFCQGGIYNISACYVLLAYMCYLRSNITFNRFSHAGIHVLSVNCLALPPASEAWHRSTKAARRTGNMSSARQCSGEVISDIPTQFAEAWRAAVSSRSRTKKGELFKIFCSIGGNWGRLLFSTIVSESLP